jgi:hypothetical protein
VATKTQKEGKVFTPYFFQEDALLSTSRFTVMLGGTGSGKTFFSPVWLSSKIASDVDKGVAEDARYLVLGPTADMVRDILVPFFTQCYQGTALEGSYAVQAAIYTLPTGGKIYFRSADQPLRIEGHQFRAASVDEPSQMKALIWPVIQARTAMHRAPVLFTGYPTNMGWYFHDIFQAWKRGDTDFTVIQFKSTDNPLYPKEEFEKARHRLPDWLFKMRYLGQFTKPQGLVYPDFGESCFVDPFDVPNDAPVYIGLDPGVFFFGLFLAWIDGVYYAYAEYYIEEVRPGIQHARELLSRVRGLPQAWIYDPARITDVTDLAANGVGPLIKATNAIFPGISALTELIKTDRFKVMRGRCPNFVDQMEKYSFPTDNVTGDIRAENPIKKDDHGPDCARYLAATLEGTQLQQQTRILTHDEYEDISRY